MPDRSARVPSSARVPGVAHPWSRLINGSSLFCNLNKARVVRFPKKSRLKKASQIVFRKPDFENIFPVLIRTWFNTSNFIAWHLNTSPLISHFLGTRNNWEKTSNFNPKIAAKHLVINILRTFRPSTGAIFWL